MFGYWAERKHGVDRFELLKETHPNLYKYCMNNLGMKDVIGYIDSNLKSGQIELFKN
jgi:hypothetical protein